MFAGVYETWDLARHCLGGSANLFDGLVWTESVRSAAIQARHDFRSPNSPCEWYERELLTLLALEMNRKRRVHVLDFGGGPATTFFSIAGKIPAGDLRYDIVDTPANCAVGGELAAEVDGVRFIPANPEDDLQFDLPRDEYDVVMSSSTIQYSRDWRRLVQRLAECEPEFFVLLRLLAGPMPTFTTIQSVVMTYGPHVGRDAGRIPCTFINSGDLQGLFESLGYTVLVDVFGRSYAEELKQLPEPYCAGHLRTAIFKRK